MIQQQGNGALWDGVMMFEPGGTGLVWLLWIVAFLGLAVVAFIIWPKLAARGPLAVLGRFGTQIAASALIVLAVAGTLNQQNGWYGSWGDLADDITGNTPAVGGQAVRGDLNGGSDYNQQAATTADLKAQKQFGTERAAFQRVADVHKNPAPLGQYVEVKVPGLSPAAGPQAGKMLVWLPPTYVSGPQQATYPVIEAYSGIPGSPQDYSKRMNLQNLIVGSHHRSGLVEPIVIIPDYTPGGLDTECVDAPGVAMETWLTKTVPTWALHHLRVRPGRASWAAMGFSAGGFCAEVSAFLHPGQYGAAMLFGTYNQPDWGSWLPFGRKSSWPARYNMLTVLQRTPPPIDVWVEDSESDRFSAPQVVRLVAAVRRPTSVTTVRLVGAGHRFSVWETAMPNALDWLARSEPGFRGHPSPVAAKEHPRGSTQQVLPPRRRHSAPKGELKDPRVIPLHPRVGPSHPHVGPSHPRGVPSRPSVTPSSLTVPAVL